MPVCVTVCDYACVCVTMAVCITMSDYACVHDLSDCLCVWPCLTMPTSLKMSDYACVHDRVWLCPQVSKCLTMPVCMTVSDYACKSESVWLCQCAWPCLTMPVSEMYLWPCLLTFEAGKHTVPGRVEPRAAVGFRRKDVTAHGVWRESVKDPLHWDQAYCPLVQTADLKVLRNSLSSQARFFGRVVGWRTQVWGKQSTLSQWCNIK